MANVAPNTAPQDIAWEEWDEKLDQGIANKFDAGKARFDLIDTTAMHGLALALTHGANKYGDNNWRAGMPWSRVLGSLQRHVNAFTSGEHFDTESGMAHTWHMLANVMFLANFEQHHPQFNDLDGTVGFLPCAQLSPNWTRVFATDPLYYEATKEFMQRYHPQVHYSLIIK